MRTHTTATKHISLFLSLSQMTSPTPSPPSQVALEMMSYHSCCGEDELSKLSKEEVPNHMAGVDE